jgi:hypothetical protein
MSSSSHAQSETTSRGKEGRAVAYLVLDQIYATWDPPQDRSEQCLAVLKRPWPQVLAIEFQEIKGVEDGLVVVGAAVQLVEIPTDDEIHDNIVAYWVPEAKVEPKKAIPFSYLLYAFSHSGQRPRRTIRFVLFTGEEQGLDGSFAYIKQHQSEMANHLGDLVLDAGQGAVKGFQLGGREDLVEVFQPFADSLANFDKISVDDKVESGTDTLPFSMAGLPGINMRQDTADYKFTHHSAADTLEAQKPEVLTQNATLMALAAFWIADRPERFAAPWPAARTAKMLVAQHEDEMLKVFGLWPKEFAEAEKKDEGPK